MQEYYWDIPASQRVRMHISQPVAQSEPITASSVQELSLNDSVPNEAVWIGSLKVGDNGFSKTGNLDTTLRLAREEAAKVGGNLVKITKHKAPSTFGSSCHRIEADIYRIDTPLTIASSLLFDSTHYHKRECVLHLFRKETWGAALGYDITINDSLLTRSNKLDRNNYSPGYRRNNTLGEDRKHLQHHPESATGIPLLHPLWGQPWRFGRKTNSGGR